MLTPFSHYHPPRTSVWTGRATRPEIGKQYWYQSIERIHAEKVWKESKAPHIGLLGYACDEGVRRNLGRTGAKNGPWVCREHLAKMAFHHASTRVADFGDVVCPDRDMETCQKTLSQVVQHLISQSIFPMLIGGGHDISYGHFKGLWTATDNNARPKIGLINFDAHFDLRRPDTSPNSGTPFFQILTEYPTAYCVIGIQQTANPPELFDIAKNHHVEYVPCEECHMMYFETLTQRLRVFVEQVDRLYISIDLDGFSSAYAPGVSAPSPLGFSPDFVLHMLRYLFASQKVIACDIAELNPDYDQDHNTAKLTALLVDAIVGEVSTYF